MRCCAPIPSSAGSIRCRASSVTTDFSRGHCGWSQLVGNYEDDLDAMLPGYAQHTSAMLSTLPHWDSGSHGGMGFVLRAEDRDAAAQAARRTSPSSATPSASAGRSGSRSISPSSRRRRNSSSARPMCARSASCSISRAGDQDGGAERVMPHLRFLNARTASMCRSGSSSTGPPPFKPIGDTNKTISHYHLSPEGWRGPAGGAAAALLQRDPDQDELDLSVLRLRSGEMKALALRCNDRTLRHVGLRVHPHPAR